MTPEEELTAVQKAIATILSGGQEVDIEVNQNRRRITRASLKLLYEREKELKALIRRQNGGGIIHAIPR
jgi:hypothetical protein